MQQFITGSPWQDVPVYGSAEMNEGYAGRVLPFLHEGETLEAAENAVAVATAEGVRASGVGLRIGGALGDRLGRRGAVKGDQDSIARAIPYRDGGLVLGVTERRVGLWTGPAMGDLAELWSAPRGVVAGVERRPRLQILARFRLHFEDGSSTAFLTPKRATIDRLSELLGRAGT